MRRVLRYEIPVDGQWHQIGFRGKVLAVGCRTRDVVEFWADTVLDDGKLPETAERVFRVFGTGQPLEDDAQYVGSTYTPDRAYMWHVFRRWP